ncbi:hypothetical protein ACRALDRAFT_2027920 [Sodiomyces alcalophilus JCM 7366]|uniref:uncharacterized protein n=1 Tax=Sodiomyces alcalophilus JCM 7366 TaxID=591952 RepID=UPI0039B54CE4
MRFHAALLAGAFALAHAQESGAPDNSVISIPTPTGVDPAASSAAARVNACLGACDSGDVVCQAACIAVPAPNASQAVDATNCAARCDQGDGSPADTEAYSRCVGQCVSQHFFSEGQGTPQPTNAASNDDSDSDSEATPTGTETGTAATQTGGTRASGSPTGSPTADSDSAQQTDDDADDDNDSDNNNDDSDNEESGAPRLLGSLSLAAVGLAAAFFL